MFVFEHAVEAPASQPRPRAVARIAARAGDAGGSSPICSWSMEARNRAPTVIAFAATATTAVATTAAHGRVAAIAAKAARGHRQGRDETTRALRRRPRRRLTHGGAPRQARARAIPPRAAASLSSSFATIHSATLSAIFPPITNPYLISPSHGGRRRWPRPPQSDVRGARGSAVH